MKTDKEWFIKFCDDCVKNQSDHEDFFRQIQADALEHTCQIMAVHADDPSKAFGTIFKLKESLRPKPTPK